MSIRLYLDENVQQAVTLALRSRGVDVLHVDDVGRKGFDDPSQMAFAAEENRAIFTYNKRDFIPLHAFYLSERREHGGLIVANVDSVSIIINKLTTFLQSRTASDIQNELWYI
jgi:predicted nuclease of predicted toxin-antitoxin system